MVYICIYYLTITNILFKEEWLEKYILLQIVFLFYLVINYKTNNLHVIILLKYLREKNQIKWNFLNAK